ncbi:MAG: hydroxyacid dehydrogenase [Actinobacteria bacterium]|jgi:D-3-phosphoglycerate dehydrogenase|nr:hydroxyacid dehydrogenase [Acidimicrobiia bacterium]NDH97333.1 hydroxyacid dehydrogenase [Actinomycetota bacterium]
MKVLLADALPDAAVERLEAAGDEVTRMPDLDADTLPEHIAGFEVLIVRSTKVTAAALDQADSLGLIVRAGAGTNTIDCDRAAELGVFVCNVPGKNALAVAELTMGLLLAIDRHIAAGTADLRTGTWNKKAYSKAEGLFGRRMGIIGVGDIGIATAARASAFGIDVIAVAKPSRSDLAVARAEAAGITFVDTLDELLTTSDIVSLHVPGSTDTKGMVDSAFLAKMKDGAVLLNTSRGDVVDEAALIDAMDNRGMRAGLDVYANEPGSGTAEFDSALAKHPSVVGTHHVGASTNQAQVAVTDGTIDTVQAYRAGEPVNCVNLDPVPVRAATLTVRHHDRVGVLASVLQILRKEELNVSNMQNRVFAGSKAAVASIDVGHLPSAEIVDEVQALEDVIYISVTPA